MSKAAHTSLTAPLRLLNLLPELTAGIAEHIPAGAVLPFACTSKQCLEAAKTAHPGGLRAHPRWMCVSSVSLVEWALKEPKVVTLSRDLLRVTAKIGNLPVLKFLNQRGTIEHYCLLTLSTFWDAASSGNIEVVKWFNTKGFECNTSTFAFAAAAAKLDLLKWLFDQNCLVDERAATWAAKEGHIDVLEWLWKNNFEFKESAFYGAAVGGHIHVLEWLYSKKGAITNEVIVCAGAADYGHINVLKWLRNKGCKWDKDFCIEVAEEAGRDEVVQWIRTQPADEPTDESEYESYDQ